MWFMLFIFPGLFYFGGSYGADKELEAEFVARLIAQECASNLHLFSLEMLKSELNQETYYAAFPEEKLNRKTSYEDPNLYIRTAIPITSTKKLAEIIKMNHKQVIQGWEDSWLILHRSLHELIFHLGIKNILQTSRPDRFGYRKWQKEYLDFFFEPLILNDPFNPEHYKPMNAKCPHWLKQYYEELIKENPKFEEIFKRMSTFNNEMQRLQNPDLIYKSARNLILRSPFQMTVDDLAKYFIVTNFTFISS